MKSSCWLRSVSVRVSPSGPVTTVSGRSNNIQKHIFAPISSQSQACQVSVLQMSQIYTLWKSSKRSQNGGRKASAANVPCPSTSGDESPL
ncbi:uncharacterized [Tachysurus ichikawai]